jgi:Domain of unknown function (DUF4136)
MVRLATAMKSRMPHTIAFIAALFLRCGGLPAQDVKSDFVRNYDFSSLKRFGWKENHLQTFRTPDENKALDAKIMRAVKEAMAAKGIVEDATSADFDIFYEAGAGDQISQVGSPLHAGSMLNVPTPSPTSSSTWGVGAGSSAGFAPNVWYSLEGQVTFYVEDTKSKVVVWQGYATKKWKDVPKARKNEDREIKEIIGKVLRSFPPKAK